jgi:hypothetical protein
MQALPELLCSVHFALSHTLGTHGYRKYICVLVLLFFVLLGVGPAFRYTIQATAFTGAKPTKIGIFYFPTICNNMSEA